MKTNCPFCGAELEFRYDDSFVRVCGSCRSSILRTDRGVESLGKVADLADLPSPLKLFTEGRFAGVGFIVIGRTQHRHSAGGTWQEWYAKMDDGRWGWLAEAQGRMYLTFESPGAGTVPAWQQLQPGAIVPLLDGVPRMYTVNERATGQYLAAEGEVPYRFQPGAQFWFADLGDPDGRFATIDYGVAGQPPTAPTVYLGRQVTPADLGLQGGEDAGVGAARLPAVARKLACPSCDGSLDLRAPDSSMRVVCPFCGAMLDATTPALQILSKLEGTPWKAPSILPLGSKVTFEGRELTLIGTVGRGAIVDGTTYPFTEYLLHHPELGFRWLVESDGHWSYVQPVAPAAVSTGGAITYRGQAFKPFQYATLTVRWVVGEFYWKVEVGEEVSASDYVSAPAMLSSERSSAELNWSLGTYLDGKALAAALGPISIPLPSRVGVGPHQPNPWSGPARVLGWSMLALVAALVVRGVVAKNRTVMTSPVRMSPMVAEASPDEEPGAWAPPPTGQLVYFSQPFALRSLQNVQITLTADVSNSWVAIGGDLIHEDTGRYVMFDRDIEFYSGYDGEAWTEGSHTTDVHLPAVPAGSYVLRLEATLPADSTGHPEMSVVVKQDVFRWMHALVAAGALGLPTLVILLLAYSFERRRRSTSDLAPAGLASNSSDDEDDE